jgi:hypothetical protein
VTRSRIYSTPTQKAIGWKKIRELLEEKITPADPRANDPSGRRTAD